MLRARAVQGLGWRELLDQRPPDLLLVLNERLGFCRRHVPEWHAKFNITLLHGRRVEGLTKSLAQASDYWLWRSCRSGKAHESDGRDPGKGLRNSWHIGKFRLARWRHLTD